ncbi:MAG TPA: hypothetical protein PKA13_24940 [Geminicoccaceae bacterium]|mgnify:CR=1 FL=1|nr:hypothetical protein [Geminicoccus sp.]HMU53044.1 hypothetical protein [Geminicoccaceae bacterium]
MAVDRCRKALAVAAVLGPSVLLGCSGSEPRPAVSCPAPGIVAGLETTTAFRNGTSSGAESDLLYAVAMQNIDGGCTYGGDGMVIQLSVDLVVEPGPAFTGGQVSIPWFVAVADPAGTIIDKQTFAASVELAAGAVRGGTRESIEQRYAGVDATAGAGYRLYLGLEIDRDEALRRRATLP